MNTQFLELPKGKLAYHETGSGPLVLCVPGMGDIRAQYRFLMPRLAESGFRAAAMDVRGMGETSASWDDYSIAGVGSDMLALIRHLDGGPAVIIGNSFAAGAAVWAAVQEPELVRGLVLIGPAVHGELSTPFKLLMNAMFSGPWGPAMWVSYFKTLFPSQKPADFMPYTAALKANLSQSGRMAALRGLIFAPKTAAEERLEQVETPSLVIMGSLDRDFPHPREEAEWVAGKMKAHLEMIQDAGHYPHVEIPETTIPLVLSFLNSLPELTASQPQEAAHAG